VQQGVYLSYLGGARERNVTSKTLMAVDHRRDHILLTWQVVDEAHIADSVEEVVTFDSHEEGQRLLAMYCELIYA
jgi:hypothetical protein